MLSSFLASKPVLDADQRAIGRVAGAERDAKTRETVSLLIRLDPGRASEGARTCWMPVDRVERIRRDGIHLTVSVSSIVPREAGRRGAHPAARR